MGGDDVPGFVRKAVIGRGYLSFFVCLFFVRKVVIGRDLSRRL